MADTRPQLSAGIARRCITPTRPIYQSGYARTSKSVGVYQQIYVRALTLEDEAGQRVAILTAELLDFSQPMVEKIHAALKLRLGLDERRVLLAPSHTHCGPTLDHPFSIVYDEIDHDYVSWVCDTCVDAIAEAADSTAPVAAEFATSRAVFGVNRRRPDLDGCPMRPNPAGRYDPEVSILKLTASDDRPVAVLFSYACHPTTMGGELIGGDYPGHAMLVLEKEFPGANAMFLQGCLGDVRVRMVNGQGRFCRGSLDDIRAFGRELSLAVTTGLGGARTEVTGPLSCHRETVSLPFRDLPTEADLKHKAEHGSAFQSAWAKVVLERIARDGSLPTERPAVVQSLGIGPFRLIAFNDQTCVGYQLKLKEELRGTPLMVAAHCGNSRSYVPTVDMIPEGGYEVEAGIYSALQPAPLAAETESILLETALRLAQA